MKVLAKKMLVERDHVEHTKAERHVLARVAHPFLMELHYAFQSSSQLFFVMDYMPGGELFAHIARMGGHLEEASTSFYAAEIALGLAHLHKMGVIYRGTSSGRARLGPPRAALRRFAPLHGVGEVEACRSLHRTPCPSCCAAHRSAPPPRLPSPCISRDTPRGTPHGTA